MKLTGGAIPPTSLCTNGACYNKLQQVIKKTNYKEQGGNKNKKTKRNKNNQHTKHHSIRHGHSFVRAYD